VIVALTRIAALSLAFGEVNRATFHPDGVTPESDTTHTVMLALLAFEIAGGFPELRLDMEMLLALALVHDLPEAYAGDTDTTGGLTQEQQAAKKAREADALKRIRSELFGSGIPSLIDAYERDTLPEARFLRYLDKITPKLTHALNGGAAIRAQGRTVEWLRERHRTQGAELAAKYPEFAGVLGPIFDAACAESERALAESLARGAA
jgi:5'-deoxynucleotidase YfbR-like HD superfamily hydrolase